MNERHYPHIVELPVPFGGFRDTSFEIEEFHRDRKLESKYGRDGTCDIASTIRLLPTHSGISSAASGCPY